MIAVRRDHCIAVIIEVCLAIGAGRGQGRNGIELIGLRFRRALIAHLIHDKRLHGAEARGCRNLG